MFFLTLIPHQAWAACIIRGVTPVKADTPLYDAESGGRTIGQMSGVKLPLQLSHFGHGRFYVQTTSAKGYVRIEGWASQDAFRFFAGKDLSVVGSHVWITKGQEVTIADTATDKLLVSRRVAGSKQKVRTKVGCDQIVLEPGASQVMDSPPKAHGYQMKGSLLELYDSPDGKVVFKLLLEGGASKAFWSSERRGNFVHLLSQADITIDGWAKVGGLRYLRHDALTDSTYVAPQPWPLRQMKLDNPPAVLVAEREVRIRSLPAVSGAEIGAIEKGARFYPMEVSGEWINVLPENLGVLPPDGGGFWVRREHLPKK